MTDIPRPCQHQILLQFASIISKIKACPDSKYWYKKKLPCIKIRRTSSSNRKRISADTMPGNFT